MRVLAGFGEHLEFVRRVAADGSGVGGHRAKLQAQPREDARIGVVHRLVGAQHARLVGVERVGVLHDELARAHHAEARPDLVAELGLDVIEIHRQLAIALDFLARDVGDDLLRGRLENEVALVPVLQAQQLRAVLVPASGLLPQLGGLHHRHQQFDRAGAIHLLAHDGLDLAQHAQAQRHPGVDAGGQAT